MIRDALKKILSSDKTYLDEHDEPCEAGVSVGVQYGTHLRTYFDGRPAKTLVADEWVEAPR